MGTPSSTDPYLQVTKYFDSMRLHLVPNSSVELGSFSLEWINLSVEADEITSQKNYGNVIDTLYVGLICVNPRFDTFFKVRKPRYFKELIRTDEHDMASTMVESRSFEMEIKFDYHKMVQSDIGYSNRIIVKSIIDSIPLILRFKNLKAFEAIQFEADLSQLF